MKRKIQLLFGTVVMLAALVSIEPLSHKAFADDDDNHKKGLEGSWAFQFTGSVNLPAPFNAFNGPFFRNGRFVADRNGSFRVTSVIANYNGVVSADLYAGTYRLNSDGTFTMQINNLPFPAFPPGTPNVFRFDGVLGDNGKVAKVVLSGVTLFGAPQPNIGSVIAGEFVKQ